ncbi:MAG: ROK family protein [Chloroflexi bacterium]|nr:ROK family protein [Chloroflexota bacterium]MCL5108316.1 ROK family protein [Chloroflexota bacterium]
MERDLVVGIDLGGTRFRVGLFRTDGKMIRRQGWATEAAAGPHAVIDRLATAVRETCAREGLARVVGVGLGSPGPLDPWRGVVLETPNMPGWHNVPLKEEMETRLGLPVHVNNDANLAALGESSYGAATGLRDVVYFTVSTGIGGGVLVDGKLLLGAHGLAAELGHTIILPEGPLCGCGHRGCLESVASGTAIAREARLRLARGDPSSLLGMSQEDLATVDAEMVARAAAAGDPLAGEVFDTAAGFLGLGVVNALHTFDPEIVVIGGGVSLAGDLLFRPVRRVVSERAMVPYRDRAPIVPAALGDDAGLYGAAALVLTEVFGGA